MSTCVHIGAGMWQNADASHVDHTQPQRWTIGNYIALGSRALARRCDNAHASIQTQKRIQPSGGAQIGIRVLILLEVEVKVEVKITCLPRICEVVRHRLLIFGRATQEGP